MASVTEARGIAAPADSLQLTLPRIFAFSMPAITTAALAVMMGQFMPRYFAGHLGMSLAAVGGVISAVRLVDTFVELPLGWVMDKTQTRLGRHRPWYIIGVPILAIAVYALFVGNADGMDARYLFVWYFIFSIGSSIMTLAHGAWAATLATNYHQRSRVFGWMAAVGTIGSVSLLALPKLTQGQIQPGKAEDVVIIGWMILIALPILATLSAILSPEPKVSTIKRDKVVLKDYWDMIRTPTALALVVGDLLLTMGPGLTGPIYVFFFTDVKHFSVGDVTTLLIFYLGAPFVGAPLWARVARMIGKHRTLQLGTVLYVITQSTLMALPAGTFWFHAAGMFAVGLSNACFALMVRAMLADYSDELRLKQGLQRVSLLYSFVGVTLKVGSSFNVVISFAILSMVGYQAAEGAVNTPAAINGLAMTYLFAPIVFVALGGLCFFGYKLDEKRHAEIREELDRRDATAAEAEMLEPQPEG